MEEQINRIKKIQENNEPLDVDFIEVIKPQPSRAEIEAQQKADYEALAASKIHEKYPSDEEAALLRKELSRLYEALGEKPSPEFQAYDKHAEQCKVAARAEIAKK